MKRMSMGGLATVMIGILVSLLFVSFPNPPIESAHGLSQVAPSEGTKEGIQVHGHWVIEVRNTDGSLAIRREFKNALHSVGATFLGTLLVGGGSPSVDEWGIGLIAATNTGGNPGPCSDGFGNTDCLIYDPAGSVFDSSNPSHFNTLTSQAIQDGFTLSGTALATRDGDLGEVFTYVYAHTAGAPQSSDAYVFTQNASIGTISVLNGQAVQVSVTLTFS